MYNLLELLVWGCKSRTYKRLIYGKRKQRKQPLPRVIIYGLPRELFKGETSAR
jgi:hypothetical protein